MQENARAVLTGRVKKRTPTLTQESSRIFQKSVASERRTFPDVELQRAPRVELVRDQPLSIALPSGTRAAPQVSVYSGS